MNHRLAQAGQLLAGLTAYGWDQRTTPVTLTAGNPTTTLGPYVQFDLSAGRACNILLIGLLKIKAVAAGAQLVDTQFYGQVGVTPIDLLGLDQIHGPITATDEYRHVCWAYNVTWSELQSTGLAENSPVYFGMVGAAAAQDVTIEASSSITGLQWEL